MNQKYEEYAVLPLPTNRAGHQTRSAWGGKTSPLFKGAVFNVDLADLEVDGFFIAETFRRAHLGTNPAAGIRIAELRSLIGGARIELRLGDQ